MLRCAAGEALGRMSQVGGEANLVAQIAQTSFDTLKTTKEAVSRMGHSLVLGCLHRYVGGMGSGQHLQTSVTILHSLTRDTTSPTVQVNAAVKVVSIALIPGFQSGSYIHVVLEGKSLHVILGHHCDITGTLWCTVLRLPIQPHFWCG